MVSSRRQLSPCPVCNRTDQVKRMQAAYEAGLHHFAPPPMPESQTYMMKYICIGMALVGIGAFLILVLISTGVFLWVQMAVTLAFIVAALVLSFLAIRHIGQGDEQARQRYPIWDVAMANWNRLHYCERDKVVYDTQTNKVLSDSAVKALLDMDRLAEQQGSQTQVAVSH